MQCLMQNEPQKLTAFVAWLLNSTKGYGLPELVNPGGVEVWKTKQAGNVSGLDSIVDHFNVTPQQSSAVSPEQPVNWACLIQYISIATI